jgi:hypothetical protein
MVEMLLENLVTIAKHHVKEEEKLPKEGRHVAIITLKIEKKINTCNDFL